MVLFLISWVVIGVILSILSLIYCAVTKDNVLGLEWLVALFILIGGWLSFIVFLIFLYKITKTTIHLGYNK